MFTLNNHRRNKPLLIAVFAGYCLFSRVALGQDAANPPQTNETGNALPPVGQVLVPEGILAIKLADALKLGSVTEQAKAEELLSNLGIEPENGWIADYPVTPAVLGEIEKDVAAASEHQKLGLTKEEAQKAVAEMKSGLGFAVKPGAGMPVTSPPKPGNTTLYRYTDAKGVTHFTDDYDSIPEEYRKAAKKISPPKSPNPAEQTEQTGGSVTPPSGPEYHANPDPGSIDDYYNEQGPPVVTYYAPPQAYDYLYDWFPYPFWSAGFYFPGYFVLSSFRHQVVFNRKHYFVSHQGNRYYSGEHQHDTSPSLSWPSTRHSGTEPMRWYANTPAQAGAQAILTHQQSRHYRIDEERKRLQSDIPLLTSRPSEAHQNHLQQLRSGSNRTFNTETHAQQVYQSRPYHYDNVPMFHQPVVHQYTGGFQHGESFHNGGFSRSGGGFGGGIRGGHR